MAGERDPRREPAVGDVLRSGPWKRTVTGIGGLRGWQVRYVRVHDRTKYPEGRYCNTHEGWWRWARNAEIVQLGDASC